MTSPAAGKFALNASAQVRNVSPVVVIPLSTQHYMMLRRNLIYTGITRGKGLVVLVGQKRALAMAVKGKRDERRWSKLKERLLP
jgi:exodeoxyribonuclease V alpha subunit